MLIEEILSPKVDSYRLAKGLASSFGQCSSKFSTSINCFKIPTLLIDEHKCR